MGKKTVQLDEVLHQEIENLQKEFMKETGEKPPSKEKVIEAGIKNSHENEILETVFQEKKKEKRTRDGAGSKFDDLFTL